MLGLLHLFINTSSRKFSNFPATQTKSRTTLCSIFHLCKNPQEIKQIHARFIIRGLHQNPTLFSQLIDSYSNFGHLNLSYQVFLSIETPNSVLYGNILRTLSKFDEHSKTLKVYKDMSMISMYPDEITFPLVIKSCSCLLDFQFGKQVHGHMVKLGFESVSSVSSALEEMYNEFSGFHGTSCKMKIENLGVESVTVIKLLKYVVDSGRLGDGKVIHCSAMVRNLCRDLSVKTAILSMYGKLNCLVDARKVFDKMVKRDRVVWNIMISFYSLNGFPLESLTLLRRMTKSNIRADLFTVIPAVSSIKQMKSITCAKEMHASIMRNNLDYQVSVHNSLIDMYSNCCLLDSARKIFNSVLNKTTVSWSSMIKGYVSHDQPIEAFSLFFEMKLDRMQVDFVAIINILPACVSLGGLERVKYIHGYSLKFGLNSLSSVNTALLITYSKCGCIEMTLKIFEEENIDTMDIIIWNSIITSNSKHGNWSKCFELYDKMKQQSGLRPDQVTFLGLLTACVNSGRVEEGRALFKEMEEVYGCKPKQEHYASMVNLLGRAGHVSDAFNLVKAMPVKPDARVWGPLLSACRMNSETDMAEFAAEKLIKMEPENAGNYILLSNIYASAGKWHQVAKMRSFLQKRGLRKIPGCSWLEINGCVHEFRVADRSHSETCAIYRALGNLESEINVFSTRKMYNLL